MEFRRWGFYTLDRLRWGPWTVFFILNWSKSTPLNLDKRS
nr:MAG TPA: hypothetical protein [Caudoviricetes sp.]